MESKNTMNERYKETVQTIFDMAEFYKQVDWEKEDYDQCHAFNVMSCAKFLALQWNNFIPLQNNSQLYM